MKCVNKLLVGFLVLSMLLCLCACQNAAPDATDPTTGEVPSVTDEVTEPVLEDGKALYTVTVQDEGGNPVEGVMVQLCLDTCVPAITDDKGVATWTLDEADYVVKFTTDPVGYDYTTDAREFYFADDSHEMTITLKVVA